MENYTLYFLRLYIILLVLCKESSQNQSKEREKLNAVIFFAKVDPSCAQLQEESCSLKQLELFEKTRVKHSLETAEKGHIHEDKPKTSVHCQELLKESLMSLTHYCHTVLDMKTAIASVTSKELTNDIQEPENLNNLRNARATKAKFNKKRKQRIEETIPSINAEKVDMKNVIRGPKHTEVFKIRLKRGAGAEEVKSEVVEAQSFPLVKRDSRPRWDVLDVIKHVRYSFLGDMFNQAVSNEGKNEENGNIGLDTLGKPKQDHGLFEMVTSTLKTLQEEPKSGFLMVVFGGHLKDIIDEQSVLVQSIKYVTENTDAKNTLVIVTGSCSDHLNEAEDQKGENNHPDSLVHIGGHFDEHHRNARGGVLMPVFAKGPHSNKLKECNLLYDVPLTVRKILETRSGHESAFQEPGSTWQRSGTNS